MEREPAPSLNPAALPPGTLVGSWRVVAWAGRGVHSAVYRAVQADKPFSPPVALKLALLPRDPRFPREAELLSGPRHPSIPRLWDSGEWQQPGGSLHPYIVMDWVEGVPLYDWTRQHAPSPAQQLRALAQVASALQAVHARGSVHRDVKGDNVLVRRSDGRAVLIDFGTGHFPDALTLTPPGFSPGTPAYRSPQAAVFELQSLRNPAARYRAGPADDLYALGVTACRLVTGEYPEFAEPTQDAHGTWQLETVVPPASLQHTEPRLRELILRMLSVHPEQRGTATQLAEALEQAARLSLAEIAPPPRAESTPVPRSPRPPPAPLQKAPSTPNLSVAPVRTSVLASVWPWILAAGASLTLAAAVWWIIRERPEQEPRRVHWVSAQTEQPDAGPTRLGEALTSASRPSSHEPHATQGLEEDMPPEPVPGQDVPDAKGRCPRKQQVALNGGCWAETPFAREECEDKGGYFFQKKCYLAPVPRRRRPTSSPTAPQHRSPP